LKNTGQVTGHPKRQDPGHDDPTEKSTDEPVGLPGPDLHAAERNVKTSGSESTQPVKENAEQRIRYQVEPFPEQDRRAIELTFRGGREAGRRAREATLDLMAQRVNTKAVNLWK